MMRDPSVIHATLLAGQATHTTPSPNSEDGIGGTGVGLGHGIGDDICWDTGSSPNGQKTDNDDVSNAMAGKNINHPSDEGTSSEVLLGASRAPEGSSTSSDESEQAADADISEADYNELRAILNGIPQSAPQSADQWFEQTAQFMDIMLEAMEKLDEAGRGRLWD